MKILLADNSVTMHRAVRLALKKEPFELMVTDNGSDALRICLEHKPSLLIADLDLTGITGSELIKKLKSGSFQNLGIKTILLCGNFHQVDDQHLESIPADARLWKPFESHVLITLIRTLLQSPAAGASPTFAGGEMTQNIPMGGRSVETTQQIEQPSRLIQPTVETHVPQHRQPDRTLPLATTPSIYDTDATQVPNIPAESRSSSMREKTLGHAHPSAPKENLWSSDYDQYRQDEKTKALHRDEEEIRPLHSPSENNDDYYVLDRTSPANHDPYSSLKSTPESTLTSFEKETIGEKVSKTLDQKGGDALSFYNELNPDQKAEIKNMIRTEIDRALNTWFKDKLQERLDEILKMVEEESK